jgi:hypothetical protein
MAPTLEFSNFASVKMILMDRPKSKGNKIYKVQGYLPVKTICTKTATFHNMYNNLKKRPPIKVLIPDTSLTVTGSVHTVVLLGSLNILKLSLTSIFQVTFLEAGS